MRRRQFLGGISTLGSAGIVGCSDVASPDMEPMASVQPNPSIISVDTNGDEYYGTYHNTGDAGYIRVELWFFKDATVPSPDNPNEFVKPNRQDRIFDVARGGFFAENERREVSIKATQQPEHWRNRDFGMLPCVATYGATFQNNGGTGEVDFKLEYRDSNGYDLTEPPTQLETVGADEQVTVTFNIVIPKGVEYEILAEPR